MAKKAAEKNIKKKKATVKKKTSTKKKVSAKASAKKSPFKSKLGHDPLAWITGEDASDLGLSFDEIEADSSQHVEALDQIVPAEVSEPVASEVTAETVIIEEAVVEEKVSVNADEGWGLFEDDDVPIGATTKEEVSDDGSWGLFGDDEATTSDSLPIGEGTAWGLFADEAAEDSIVDYDALTIHLPANFNVAGINEVFHEFEAVVSKNQDVIVDASNVDTVDAIGLQLLYAGHKELQKHGCKMVIKDASDRVELLSKSTFINEIIGISG
jgi:anti-anti-sigma regulatory factor